MPVQRLSPASRSVLDVLERVLERGIVIETWVGVSVAGIRVVELNTRIVVASLATYVSRSEALSRAGEALRPALSVDEDSPVPALPDAPPAGVRRRRRTPPPPPVAYRLQCATGCTFERFTAKPPARMRCPYHQRVRCAVHVAEAVTS
jgi:hypothetical protein